MKKEHHAHHLVPPANEDGHGPGVLALLNDQHAVLGGAEADLLHQTGGAEFLGRQLAETRNDTPSSGYGNELHRTNKHM